MQLAGNCQNFTVRKEISGNFAGFHEQREPKQSYNKAAIVVAWILCNALQQAKQ